MSVALGLTLVPKIAMIYQAPILALAEMDTHLIQMDTPAEVCVVFSKPKAQK